MFYVSSKVGGCYFRVPVNIYHFASCHLLEFNVWTVINIFNWNNFLLICLSLWFSYFFLKNNRHLFLKVLEPGSLRSRCKHGQILWRALFLACSSIPAFLLCVLTWWERALFKKIKIFFLCYIKYGIYVKIKLFIIDVAFQIYHKNYEFTFL